ncbi:thaumatin family protein [Streptomyces sp. V4-01]|uniref:Thaumatin family protein n=1 Tax=Actinacidiphila polyblastidii TaxID=3110430 RepID=A0ABU7PJP9_9ACTN|nr:thaumatin family protein [Streptomyces sp. V4-01]
MTVPAGAASPTATPAGTPSAARPPAARAAVTATPRRSAVRPARSPAALRPRAGTRLFTFVNHVDQTLWLAAGEQTAQPALTTTGWVLPPGRTLTVRVPDHWNGRFWGRTGCAFDAAGRGHCETGDCAGRFQCAGYGVIPASLAEFDLNSWDGMDFYDVSLVDGSNLPMYVNLVGGTTKDPLDAAGCSAAGCTRTVACPPALRVTAGGRAVGCESPCGVFGTDQYCCRGQWAPRDKCRPDQWPVDYAALFKEAEPFAYSYVDDDATSTFTSRGEAGYRITFGVSP